MLPGSQTVGHDWATELNWTELNWTEGKREWFKKNKTVQREEFWKNSKSDLDQVYIFISWQNGNIPEFSFIPGLCGSKLSRKLCGSLCICIYWDSWSFPDVDSLSFTWPVSFIMLVLMWPTAFLIPLSKFQEIKLPLIFICNKEKIYFIKIHNSSV